MEVKNKELQENQQEMEAQLARLQDNKIFQVLLTQLSQLLKTKRKEQRSALQSCDNMLVFRLEGEISGIEEFLKLYDGQIKMLDKLSGDLPTVFKY